MKTNKMILRHNSLKDNLVEVIRRQASEHKDGILVIDEPLELAYSSGLNGWCNDFLGAVTADGDAFFIEENSSFSEDSILTNGGKISWNRIPIDDKCIIMDAIHRRS